MKNFLLLSTALLLAGPNQTDTYSEILDDTSIPFTITIEEADFSLPIGIQTYAFGTCNGKWALTSGRVFGLHDLNPPDGQSMKKPTYNTTILVIDPTTGETWSKSLNDTSSGLSTAEVDTIAVVAPQFVQIRNRLYVIGGIGVRTGDVGMTTEQTLTAIDLPGIIRWVTNPRPGETAKQHIRQTSDPYLRVTGGGSSFSDEHNNVLLVFGQNFNGFYFPTSNGEYTKQVRTFRIIDNEKKSAHHRA